MKISVGDRVMFVSQSAADRWGKFRLGEAYKVVELGERSCSVRDKNGIAWWITYKSLVLEHDDDVTEGWTL